MQNNSAELLRRAKIIAPFERVKPHIQYVVKTNMKANCIIVWRDVWEFSKIVQRINELC